MTNPPRIGRWPSVLTALALALAGFGVHAQVAAQVPAAHEPGVDARVKPGDDFFAYANGAWLQATVIPADKPRRNARDEINDTTAQQLATVLAEAANAPAGTRARKLADFHAAYLDEAAINARGLAVIEPYFARIERIKTPRDLAAFLGQEMPADVDPLIAGRYHSAHVLGLAVSAPLDGAKTYVPILTQGGLTLPKREHYLGADAAAQSLQAAYLRHVADMLGVAGLAASPHEAAARAKAVLAFETALAQSHADFAQSSSDRNAGNVWPLARFTHAAPGMPWPAFFAAAGLAGQRQVVVWQPSAVRGLGALVKGQGIHVWKDYLRLRFLDRHADVLPQSIAQRALALRKLAGAEPPPAREQRAFAVMQTELSDTLGRLYAERHFPPAHKARAQAIADDVIRTLAQRVDGTPWFSAASKAIAKRKLETLYYGLGHTDRWPPDEDLQLSASDALGNLQRVSQHQRRTALARLGQTVDPRQWRIPAQRPGAMLLFHLNAGYFAAALLQAPKFDPSASDAMNYGAIGAIVGHEASHFVDTLGAETLPDGRPQRWWSQADRAAYDASTRPLVQQFSDYRPLPGAPVDGQLGLVENLADLVGLNAAFDAYRKRIGARAGDPEALRRMDREFFIGFARSWRALARDSALRAQAASDHSPERYRIWTVRNVDAWYDAFDVRPGDAMYLEPAARVRVW